MNHIQEAKHCLSSAREILREKALKEDGYYLDSEFVKMAGQTAYTGILLALDDFLGKKGKGLKDVEWYKQHLSKWDKKVLNAFSAAYQILYVDMASNGIKSAELASVGLEEADKIISWLESKVAIA
jgi:hypothetical protein